MGNPKLKNRVIPNSAVDKILYDKLREYSKESKIPISRLLDENAFSSFRSDFEKEGYEVEDLLNLERYHSLNLIKTKNGRAAFITKLPKEIKN